MVALYGTHVLNKAVMCNPPIAASAGDSESCALVKGGLVGLDQACNHFAVAGAETQFNVLAWVKPAACRLGTYGCRSVRQSDAGKCSMYPERRTKQVF